MGKDGGTAVKSESSDSRRACGEYFAKNLVMACYISTPIALDLVLYHAAFSGLQVIELRNVRRTLSWYECKGQEKWGRPHTENEQCRVF